jgi:hypothetical protein
MSADHLVDVARAELIQLLIAAEDDDRDIHLAQYGELISLLKQPAFALEKRN